MGRQGLIDKSHELKFWVDKLDRQIVELRSPKREKARYMVHRLVATAFLPQPTHAHTDVVHLDKNMSNNKVKNLEWMTKIDAASIAKKTKKRWSKQGGLPKLTAAEVDQIINSELTREEIFKEYKISERHVTQIRNGHTGKRFKQSSNEKQ